MLIIEKLNSLRRPHRLHPRQPLQVHRERIGDLVLDFPRAAAHPVGEDDDLVLRQVGDGVDRRVDDGVNARRRSPTSGQEDDHEAVADGEFDDLFNHASVPAVGRLFGEFCPLAGLPVRRSPGSRGRPAWPLSVIFTGTPIEPSGKPVTGHRPCAWAAARSAAGSRARFFNCSSVHSWLGGRASLAPDDCRRRRRAAGPPWAPR